MTRGDPTVEKGGQMDTKRLVSGTVVGGLAMYALGYLFWGVLFANFFAAQAGSANGLTRDAAIMWADVAGTVSIALLVTLAIGWTGGSSVMDGFETGATLGFLFWLGADLIIYANFNFSTLTGSVADSLVELVRTGLGGAVIAAVTAGGGAGAGASGGQGMAAPLD
jgi:hypothetical protein